MNLLGPNLRVLGRRFPYLTDNEGYNSFHLTHATFNAIISQLETHPAFSATLPNVTLCGNISSLYYGFGKWGGNKNIRTNFSCSILYHEIMLHPEQWVPEGTYIIADLAYPLRTYLMKAFPNYDSLNYQE
ncbi:hypothetical protein C2G38_2179849 [Gigaspora rosea]|uniref:DDE Tnp4 domain-containing protein n=1 Tax=Gigaspora rosea TaxID=44941 RepID=A0A397VDX0_9GLOM|nr:hypothetical protein C2G38_2179849 [Gigaspora rosea]